MAFTVSSALRWWARECPETTAISVDDESVSYLELYEWSTQVANYLSAQGIQPGDRITMIAMNALNYAALALGAMRVGAICAPLNFRSTEREIHEAYEKYNTSLVFVDPERLSVASKANNGNNERKVLLLSVIDELRANTSKTLTYEPTADMPVFVIGTSGSTASPKGVIYTHNMIMTYASEFALTEPRCAHGSSVLSVGPFSSSSGYLLLMQFLAMGTTMYIESHFDPERALNLLTQQQITTLQAAPIFFERIAALDAFSKADLSNLHFAQVGGATVTPKLLKAWRDKNVTLRQAYGSCEAGGGWAARDDKAIDEPEKCGRGGLFTEYAILGDDDNFACAGTVGEILIHSPCSTSGYWENPEATQQAFKDGWFHTGDIGVMDETGNLKFIDRIKEIIISGGLNISAAEVERTLLEIDNIIEVAVIATPDDDYGETPVAIIYAQEGQQPTALDIYTHCKNILTSYKVPRYIVIENEPLPRLPSGKIAKQILRDKYNDATNTLVAIK